MVVKESIPLPPILMAAGGLLLILTGFFLLVPEGHRDAVAWLDAAVFGAVFLANFANLAVVRPSRGGFSHEIPKLGLLWTTHVTYSALAFGGVWWGLSLSFRVQLLYQIVLLFLLLTVISVASCASVHAADVESAEGRLRNSLDILRSAAGECRDAFARQNNWAPERSRFSRVYEDLRFLSPCDTQSAISLDLEMANLLNELAATLSLSNGLGGQSRNVQDKLDRCQRLLTLRKQERHG